MCVHIMIEPIRSRYRSLMFMLNIICIDVLSLSYMQDLYLQPRLAIIRINHRLEYFYLFLSHFFQSWHLMIAGKRASLFAIACGNSAMLSRKELQSHDAPIYDSYKSRRPSPEWRREKRLYMGRSITSRV